jgi:demethylmenaquinone methyltransferase/2-methoxy-6-polyprenyl-1,4-benzoquinol methylase
MIEVGRRQQGGNPNLEFVVADGTDLPFEDSSSCRHDLLGRNIVKPRLAIAELYRVLKPGGRIVVCEFSTPPIRAVRAAYLAYLRLIMPAVAKVASSNPDAYVYLADSITNWPDQTILSQWLVKAGFADVAYRNLTAGVVALHRGVKPRLASSTQ